MAHDRPGTAADDIVQETFLSILRDPDRFDPTRAPLRVFLLAVARNLARKRWRKEQRWDALDEESFVAERVDPGSGFVLGATSAAMLLRR